MMQSKAIGPRRRGRRAAAWLPLAAALLLAGPGKTQTPAQDCWAAVRMLAGLVADPPHAHLALGHYTAAHRYLANARAACTEGRNDRALREAERGIRRLQPRDGSS